MNLPGKNNLTSVMNDKQIEMLRNMGALGYPVEMVMSVLSIPDRDRPSFIKDFNDPKSDIMMKYKEGSDQAQYSMDLKLFEMACSGDLKAMKELEIRKRKLSMSQSKR